MNFNHLVRLMLVLATFALASGTMAQTISDTWKRSKLVHNSEEFVIGRHDRPPSKEDQAKFPVAILMIYDYDPTWSRNLPTESEWSKIDVFEREVRTELERDGTGLLVLSLAAGGQCQWHAYTNNPTVAKARIAKAVPTSASGPDGKPSFYLQMEDEPDPTWSHVDVYLKNRELQ